MQNRIIQTTVRQGLLRSATGLALVAACLALGPGLRADVVIDWNANAQQVILTAAQGVVSYSL